MFSSTEPARSVAGSVLGVEAWAAVLPGELASKTGTSAGESEVKGVLAADMCRLASALSSAVRACCRRAVKSWSMQGIHSDDTDARAGAVRVS